MPNKGHTAQSGIMTNGHDANHCHHAGVIGAVHMRDHAAVCSLLSGARGGRVIDVQECFSSDRGRVGVASLLRTQAPGCGRGSA